MTSFASTLRCIPLVALTVAVAAVAGCTAPAGDAEDDVATSESASTSSFDPSWLADGRESTTREAATWFHPGGAVTPLGPSTIATRERHCNIVSGCDAFEPVAREYAQPGRVEARVEQNTVVMWVASSASCMHYWIRCVSAPNDKRLICETASPADACGDTGLRELGKAPTFYGRLTTTGLWAKAVVSDEQAARAAGQTTWLEREIAITSRFWSLGDKDWVAGPGWDRILRVHRSVSYDDAVATCRSYGATVARFDRSELFAHTGLTGVSFWAGGRRDASGTFVDDRGAPFPTDSFAPYEPNNAGGIEDCAEYVPGSGINDNQCGQRRPFGCLMP